MWLGTDEHEALVLVEGGTNAGFQLVMLSASFFFFSAHTAHLLIKYVVAVVVVAVPMLAFAQCCCGGGAILAPAYPPPAMRPALAGLAAVFWEPPGLRMLGPVMAMSRARRRPNVGGV